MRRGIGLDKAGIAGRARAWETHINAQTQACWLKVCLEAFAFETLAFQLPGAAHCLGRLAGPALGRLFEVTAQLHFPENAFPLHLFLQRLQRLVNVVIADENLHLVGFSLVDGAGDTGARV